MDIKILDELIEETKESDTTYANARDLAALYATRNILTNSTDIEKEIDDILPAYKNYVDVKAKYKFNETTKENVIYALNLLCREIYELIQIVYSSTDMIEERKRLQKTISELYNKYR